MKNYRKTQLFQAERFQGNSTQLKSLIDKYNVIESFDSEPQYVICRPDCGYGLELCIGDWITTETHFGLKYYDVISDSEFKKQFELETPTNTKISMFEWTEEFPMGSNDMNIGSFQDSEIDLSDETASWLAKNILEALKEHKHITLRIDDDR